jgi:hypothetical protein
LLNPIRACRLAALFSVFEQRWVRPVARLNTLYRFIFLQRRFAFDVDLFLFDQARGFVGLL